MIFKKERKELRQGYSSYIDSWPANKNKLGISINVCSDCAKKNIGARLFDSFSFGIGYGMPLMHYDREKDEILIEEDTLMSMITMVNPAQKKKRLRLAKMTVEDGKVKWTPV